MDCRLDMTQGGDCIGVRPHVWTHHERAVAVLARLGLEGDSFPFDVCGVRDNHHLGARENLRPRYALRPSCCRTTWETVHLE